MQVCCKSAGSRCSAWLGQAHLYSRVCRGSFWEMGVFLAWGIDVSTAIFEMHSERAGIGDGMHRVSHPTLGSRAIVGNPWVAEWRIGQTGKSWGPRAFIFLHPLLPWLLCRCWPGPQADDPLCNSSPCYIIDKLLLGPGGGGNGWRTTGSGAYWREGLRLCTRPEAKGENFPDCELCYNNWGSNEINRKEHWTGSQFVLLLTS